ncbi:dihydrolipoyl dehydrogenase family protein [Ilumatobacter nonamiensis]|uniref:dihydrolipoyl dehydrogenase family protein n=1 Tax=Ilumatobacter nonamiensis TaxID=467093 RepID=UPI00034A2329|nr:NAD(P)/FAD-dependent oxidoreductase [Ilumatobacter nonamiensis]
MAGSIDDNHDFTLAILGGGSASEALIRELDNGSQRIVVFEPNLMGGECPFVACIPSKAMLHDRAVGREWPDAVRRRDDLVSHLDDGAHAEASRDRGATIVRARAELTAPGVVRAAGTTYHVDHIVVATGAESDIPEIDGLDADHARVWTSDDALTNSDQLSSMIVIGGGVIGSELAFIYSGFGTEVKTLESMSRRAPDLHPRVSELVEQTLGDAGVGVVNDADVERVELRDDGVTVRLGDGSAHDADVLLVAVGRTPRWHGIGLENLGLDPDDITVDPRGRLVSDRDHDVWFMGDAAGQDQYTHVANHHAAVVADHLSGSATRRYDDVVVPACMFTEPPMIVVGPTWADLDGDDDVVWAEIELDTARSATDRLGPGFLAVAARRSTEHVIAAHGIGARFDELTHALVVAIDGEVPIRRLARSLQPFPTVGEILGEAFTELERRLSS